LDRWIWGRRRDVAHCSEVNPVERYIEPARHSSA
jgi:hypothetical protein